MSTLGSSESDVEEIRSYEEEGSSFYDDEAAHDNASGDDEEEEEDEQISASGRISEERTIEESVEQAGNEGDDSIICRPTPKMVWGKRRQIIESSSSEEDNAEDDPHTEEEDEDEDEDEEEGEERAISPRSRMSITGIRPKDLESDSSEIESVDENEETDKYDSAKENNSDNSASPPLNDSNTANVDNGSSFERKNSSSSSSSKGHERNSIGGRTTDKYDLPRYSSHFMKSIKKQLSSTLYPQNQDSLPEEIPDSEENDSKDSTSQSTKEKSCNDSDIQIIETKTPTIELFSSMEGEDDEEEEEAEANKENKTNNKEQIIPRKEEIVKTHTPKQTPKVLKQPTIPAVLRRSSLLSATPKKAVKYVSQEFHDKEVRKLTELKSELANAERLIAMIGKNLPDGGRQLELRIKSLRKDIEIKSNYIATFHVEDTPGNLGQRKPPTPPTMAIKPEGSRGQNSDQYQKLQEERKAAFKNNVPDWNELSAAVNDIKPIHTGKQGMATFNNQKALTIDRLKDLHDSLEDCPGENVLAEDPRGLKVSLMAHQKHALAWMSWREQKRPRGGILADDMGLGKTLTMISLILAHKNRRESANGESSDEETEEARNWTAKGKRKYYRGGTLVVCPASLVCQWEGEVESKVSRNKLSVCVHHGNNRDTKPKHLQTYDVVVTTYNIAAREHKTSGAIFGLNWRRIILDEAHMVRNHKAQSSMAVCELMGKYRWALTGTPIQNKEMDVYALMKFLHCTPFDELPHWRKWIDKSAGGKQRLNTIMKTLMLRRTKAQLQERGELQSLPTKTIEMIEVILEKEEMNVYQKIMIYSRTLFAEFLNQRAERNTDTVYREQANRPTFMQTKDPNGAYYQMHKQFTKLHQGSKNIKSHEILVLLLRLRQICCHPGLIDAMLEDDDGQQMDSDSEEAQPEIDLLDQLNRLTIKDVPESGAGAEGAADKSLNADEQVIAKASAKVLQRSNPVFNLKRPSSKMNRVLETVRDRILKSGDKAIIVSQWTSVLEILRNHLEDDGIYTLSLNGAVPVKLRQNIVTEFNDPGSNKKILLLSLTAGGVGLNLVGANHLLLIDLHWNPQLEAQAQDRIYRVGQRKNVTIYKFMCKNTVEERIRRLQEVKLDLANGVLTGTKGGSKLTIDDLRSLFEV